jgi:hypothetical protein
LATSELVEAADHKVLAKSITCRSGADRPGIDELDWHVHDQSAVTGGGRLSVPTSVVAPSSPPASEQTLGGMMFRRSDPTPVSETVLPGGQPELCDVCAAVICDGTEQYATVPDSSAVHPSPFRSDGWRRLVACSVVHLAELIRWYQGRPYDDDELLAHIVTRAQRHMGHEATDDDLAFMTGLTPVQIMRAMRWQAIWMSWVQDPDASQQQ